MREEPEFALCLIFVKKKKHNKNKPKVTHFKQQTFNADSFDSSLFYPKAMVNNNVFCTFTEIFYLHSLYLFLFTVHFFKHMQFAGYICNEHIFHTNIYESFFLTWSIHTYTELQWKKSVSFNQCHFPESNFSFFCD